LRELKTNGKVDVSFTTHLKETADQYYDTVFEDFTKEDRTPSYEYYEHAAQEQVPAYKVELAKSGRSQCVACKNRAARTVKATQKAAEKAASDAASSKPPPKKKARVSSNAETAEALVTTAADVTESSTDVVTTSTIVALSTTSSSYIPKDGIRIGSIDQMSGSYGRWHHLACWRVPYRIWAGLTQPTDAKAVLQDLLYIDQVLLTNLASLNAEQQKVFVEHVMDNSHWARKTAASKPPPNVNHLRTAAEATEKPSAANADEPIESAVSSSDVAAPAVTTKQAAKKSRAAGRKKASPGTSAPAEAILVVSLHEESTAIAKRSPSKERFKIPRPGMNGSIANVFAETKFVLTGIFPEVGGGMGLNLGKERLKTMIESFGGKVTSGLSGKTNFLVVGLQPGFCKVADAKRRNIPMVDIMALQARILGQVESLEAAGPPPEIQSYSAGYQGAYLMN
jgi:BRCT domain type II-containing protein